MDIIFVALSTFCEFDTTPLDRLKASGFPYKVHSSGKRITREELMANATDASVIIAGVEPYDSALLGELKKLECIVRCGVGVDAIDMVAAGEKKITVLNTPDVPTIAVAELALAMYFSLSRNLRVQANSMGQKKWERLEAHLLSGKTIGIIGFGRIGRTIAEFCKPFGVTILACDPFGTKESVSAFGVELVVKDELLHRADIISIHASRSATDALIIDRDDYAKMKKGALLVNLSRGGMIDEIGLAEALQSKQLAGAGLDVFKDEPYRGPLCDLENVILTPHSATMTIETRVAMEAECVDKALRFLANRIEPNEKVI